MQPHPDEKSIKMPHFALFIEGKLSRLRKRNRMVAEKRIMDVICKIEMSTLQDNEHKDLDFPSGTTALILMPTRNPNLFYQNNRSSTPYMDISSD